MVMLELTSALARFCSTPPFSTVPNDAAAIVSS